MICKGSALATHIGDPFEKGSPMNLSKAFLHAGKYLPVREDKYKFISLPILT